ncbi:6-phosphogluconolactonase [Gemmata sp.]|uniref:6-phosphogluconolactonase n=1 Tax=Gemmata sp. TaxID=1914242 RepID=UPI003F722E1B
MKIDVLPDADAVAAAAAALIAADAREVVAARGAFVLAVSGGRTPWVMLRELAKLDVPWDKFHVVQVDERIAPAGDPDRNLTHLRASLMDLAPIPAANLHPMPVEAADPEAAAAEYARELERLCGTPAVIDLVHLGLGPDGHTASLVPGDSVLDVTDRDVALTGGLYQKRRRMTLTYPALNRARKLLWVVTGADKPGPLVQLRAADPAIPGGRVDQTRAVVMADAIAAAKL